MPNDILSKIEAEIVQANLQHERRRLDDALFNLEFYHGDFTRFPPRQSGGTSYDSGRYPRGSLIFQRVADTLSANLYAEGPTRKLSPKEGDPARPYEGATAWLERCYQANLVDALWQQADTLGAVSDVAAFQVSASPDPERPVRVRLWDASQFCVWTDPEDPTAPLAVATIDVYNQQRRLRLYLPEIIRTYLSDVLGPNQTAGGRDFKFRGEVKNPYGIVPFSFAHFRLPVGDFWSGGPGNYLRSVNDGTNFALTEGFDCIRYNLRPILVFKHVRADVPAAQPGPARRRVEPHGRHGRIG